MANVELLQSVLKTIIDNPESWDQVDYGECFAGKTLQTKYSFGQVGFMIRSRGGLNHANTENLGYRCDAFFEARDMLGLNNSQAEHLFDLDNSLSTLKDLVDLFCCSPEYLSSEY